MLTADLHPPGTRRGHSACTGHVSRACEDMDGCRLAGQACASVFWNSRKHAWVPKRLEHSITSRDICYQLLAGDVPVKCLPATVSLSCCTNTAIAPGPRHAKGQRGLTPVQVLVYVSPNLGNARPRICQHICGVLRGTGCKLIKQQRSGRYVPSCKTYSQRICDICLLAALSTLLQVERRLCIPLRRSSRPPARLQRARQLQPQAVAPSSPELHGRQYPHSLVPKAQGQPWWPVLPAQEHECPCA